MTSVPIPPGPSAFVFPDPLTCPPDDCVAVGADLAPSTLIAAYRSGLFPMHVPSGELGWWAPVERGIIPLDGLRITRSLRRSLRRYDVTIDTAFDAVVDACADPARPGGWITDAIADAYRRLHRMGWAHSVEAWDGGDLVGGFYGVAIGGAFFGESMFHAATDASKVALVGFMEWFRGAGGALLDVQWATDHLRTLGAVAVTRSEYAELLRSAIERGPVAWPRSSGG